ncbi:MAG: methionyl-tRNA formyltransferase [Acidobacteriota bacterium]
MNVVFLGTPEFAVPTLEKIIAAGHHVQEVITQPDRPKGRRQELHPSPVKVAALRHGLPVYQPERIRRSESVEHLRALAPAVMVIVGYGQIIPQNIIDIAPLGIINVHASLLPDLRGAAPIQWAIARGFERTGVTTMRIDAGLDTGDILDKWETPIGPEETAPELSARLAEAGATILLQTLSNLEHGEAKPVPQDSARATFAPILKKEDGRIDWRSPARQIHNLIRGFQPWPGAHAVFRGQSLHLWRSRLVGFSQKFNLAPGAIVQEQGVFAAGGDGAVLELVEVQLEGRKRMPAEVFANGHRLTQHDVLT